MIIYAADDERLALDLLRDAIAEALPDTEPICFRKSAELLEKAKETPPDIVFLDVDMPGMNGIALAGELNRVKSELNIIFVTGHREYATEAFSVYASGYLTKPCTAAKITEVMAHLRYPVETRDIHIRTFGNFDIFYKGEPVVFRSPKSKELLAYLVDREGALVTRQEMAGVLFEDDFSRSVQSRLSQFAQRLGEDLAAAGITGFFSTDGGYSIDLSLAQCDLMDYRKGKVDARFAGEYMEQYSWGEYRKADLTK